MSCKNCSPAYERCPDVTTSNCVTYQGPAIPCLNLCTGDSITEVENTIALKVCELVGEVDMSTIVIPECLTRAWGLKDKNIFNLIQFALDNECTIQEQIDVINSPSGKIGVNQQFQLDYPNGCCNGPCLPGVTLTIPAHLQKIIYCLCEIRSYIGIGESDLITNLTTSILELQNDIVTLQSQITLLNNTLLVPDVAGRLSALESRVSCINTQLLALLPANTPPIPYITCS